MADETSGGKGIPQGFDDRRGGTPEVGVQAIAESMINKGCQGMPQRFDDREGGKPEIGMLITAEL